MAVPSASDDSTLRQAQGTIVGLDVRGARGASSQDAKPDSAFEVVERAESFTPNLLLSRASAELRLGPMPESAAAEARTLLSHVLGIEPGRLVLVPEVGAPDAARLAELVAARVAGTPVQHLTRRAYFRHVDVEVGPGVFTPRPETEAMAGWVIDRARELLGQAQVPIVVELCAGSAAISLAIAQEAPGCEQYAVELDDAAADYAERNLAATQVRFSRGDMATAFPDLDGKVDLVVVNPPYIPLDAFETVAEDVRDAEPHLALFSGDDGLDAMRVVVATGARLLRHGGFVAAEHAEVQAVAAPALFVASGRYDRVRDLPDLTGRPRFVVARRT